MCKRFRILVFVLLIIVIVTNTPITKAATYDVKGIKTGQSYIIINTKTGKAIDLDNGIASSNRNIIAYTYNGGQNQRWRISYSGGLYYLYSMVNTSYAMTASGSNINLNLANQTPSSKKFTIVRRSDGTYNIKYGNKYVAQSSNNIVLVNSINSYSNWSIQQTSKGDADIFGFYYRDPGRIGGYYNSAKINADFRKYTRQMGYNGYEFTNISAATALSYMRDDHIWVHSGHGTPGKMVFNNSSGGNNGNITIGNINSLPKNQLASLRVFISLGCQTGKNTGNSSTPTSNNNIVKAVYERGAHFALAWKNNVPTDKSQAWVRVFILQSRKNGYTVKKAMQVADVLAYSGSKYYAGDVYQRLSR